MKNNIFLIIFFSSSFIFSQKNNSAVSFKNLSRDTLNFSSKKLDLNLDGKKDIIFYNKWSQGDKMYFFIYALGNYKLALTTINFNLDASYKIEKINSVLNNKDKIDLKIYTLSYLKEDIEAIHFISYKDHHWYLEKTQYNAIIVNPITDKLTNFKCFYKENILLSENFEFKMFNSESKNCVRNSIK